MPVTEFGFGGQLDLLTRPLFGRLIDRVRPDIVLTWMNRATRHCPRPGRRRRFVFAGTPRGYYEPDYYRDCDAVVVTTRDLADFYVRNGIRADRLQVIPNFVPEPTAAVADRAAEALHDVAAGVRVDGDDADGVGVGLAEDGADAGDAEEWDDAAVCGTAGAGTPARGRPSARRPTW